MDLSFLNQYFVPIVVAACLCVGYILRNIVPSDKVNRFIPLVVACVGIVAACVADMTISLDTVVCGMVSGLASTGLYELFAQFIEKAGIIKGDGKADDGE